MANGFESEFEDTDDGKTVFSRHQYEALRDKTDKMSEAQFEDFNRAEMEGRVRDPEDGGKQTWTRDEWEAAADRADEMSEEEFESWDNAPKEGRVE
jgi:hypothetical protein